MRYLDSTREVEIRELCPVNDSVLKLSYVVNDWETKGHFFKHNIIAGGFCFYRFNDVSIFQWHPFSTFSSKNGNERECTVYIKREGYYTNALWRLALKNQNEKNTLLKSISLNVDGPYGSELQYSDYKQLIFVAGGIGITPVHSIIASLLDYCLIRMTKFGRLDTGIPSITLIWTVRDISLFNIVASTFQKVSIDLRSKFNVFLFVTTEVTEEAIEEVEKETTYPINKGRPDLTTMITYQINNNDTSFDEAMLYVCGPQLLIQECRELAFNFGMHFHNDTFEL